MSSATTTIDELRLSELTGVIKRTMRNAARDAFKLGYMLNRVKEERLYTGVYDDFDSYLAEELHIDYTMATRFIRINKKYAVPGDGMEIADQYEDYSQGLLIEMLNMTPEQEAQVTPDMTVKQAREIKKQDRAEQVLEETETVQEPEEVATSQLDTKAEVHGEICFVLNYWKSADPEEKAKLSAICREEKNNTDRGRAIQRYLAPYGYSGGEGYIFYSFTKGIDFWLKLPVYASKVMRMTYARFAAELMKILESEWAERQSLEQSVRQAVFPEESAKEPEKEEIIDAEFREIDEPVTSEEVATSQPDENADMSSEEEVLSGVEGVRRILEEQKKNLNDMLLVDKVDPLPANMVYKQKTIVAALAAMICDLEREQEEEAEQQPELPVLKNNDQRKEWLSDYKAWGMWYRDEHIDVNYYKYDFPDGSRLVVAEYPQRIMEWSHQKEDFHCFHLLEKNKKAYNTTYEKSYVHFPDSETYLVEFLKNLQKAAKE